ncbi:MAG: aminomethyl-transferring glycine dehydrogenase subunit GcvPB [Candidatus Bathyarchaeia archaeon]
MCSRNSKWSRLKTYRQAVWPEPSLFELGAEGRQGFDFPMLDVSEPMDLTNFIPKNLLRDEKLAIPELSEVEVVRHFTRLSQMNFSLDTGMYPLGSCTMKYNPKVNDLVTSSKKVHLVHPLQPEDTIQGSLEIMYRLSKWLEEITGMDAFSLQPSAGAQAEFAGVLMIRAYHQSRQDFSRDEILVPDSAHGTNPASASMGGYKVTVIPTGEDGCIDIGALEAAAGRRTAALMLTNPNTLGLFEKRTLEVAEIIHRVGGLLYYDGANLNAILGKARPGDMGFDIVHINLHKTFSTPHGGGGPGGGPVGVKKDLERFLPIPVITYDGKKYHLEFNRPHSIGMLSSYYGNFEVLLRAFVYILLMGAEGLKKVSEVAVLNANYMASRIRTIRGFTLPYDNGTPRKHEFVISCKNMREETGVSAREVAKRLLDFGFHAPTVYFPQMVEEALMIEPTETETLEEMDRFINALEQISYEAYKDPKYVAESPHNTSVKTLDEARASHPMTICTSWRTLTIARNK